MPQSVSQANFNVAINRVLCNEGGFVDDPRDPGSTTVFGISRRSFPNFNGGDFKTATREQAIALYRAEFWNKVHADEMPEDLAFQALDFAVNSGIPVAIAKLQRAAGVADDGHWGPVTRAAVAAANPYALTVRFIAERIDFWRSLSTWSSFGKGWAGRAAADLRYAAEDFST